MVLCARFVRTSFSTFRKELRFPLSIPSVNVSKSAADLDKLTEEMVNGKLHFLCSCVSSESFFK